MKMPSLRLVLGAATSIAIVGPSPIAVLAESNATKTIRVAIYADGGASKTGSPKVKASLPKDKGFDLKLVTAAEIQNGILDDFDVLIQPGGSGSRQALMLGEEGRKRVKNFVADGGGYVGICAGAYLASANYPWSLNLLDARVVDSEHWARGTGEVKINLTAVVRRHWKQTAKSARSITARARSLLPVKKATSTITNSSPPTKPKSPRTALRPAS